MNLGHGVVGRFVGWLDSGGLRIDGHSFTFSVGETGAGSSIIVK